jgi:hypothetical protein
VFFYFVKNKKRKKKEIYDLSNIGYKAKLSKILRKDDYLSYFEKVYHVRTTLLHCHYEALLHCSAV